MVWQYMTLVVQLTGGGGEVRVKNGEVLTPDGGKELYLHAFLSQQGEVGWELHSTIPHNSGEAIMVLRRTQEAAVAAYRVEQDRQDRKRAQELVKEKEEKEEKEEKKEKGKATKKEKVKEEK